MVHKGAYYSSIKLFNALPPHIKCLHKRLPAFKQTPKEYLIEKSFYTVDGYMKENLMLPEHGVLGLIPGGVRNFQLPRDDWVVMGCLHHHLSPLQSEEGNGKPPPLGPGLVRWCGSLCSVKKLGTSFPYENLK
ncbi:uncharacterized protein LOC126263148 [Schistocerca nitens]|uniref:uncharacterized protein LOC126263148 n=1 Tax=Schistocerca nitens TaxID=7011 RepID=UPI002117D37E|nr:uncharacterized protein LOC126263148 [Schistocerca nitens]